MIQILFHNKAHLPLNVAVHIALLHYEQAEHTQGHEPAQFQLNPLDYQPGIYPYFQGVPVVASDDVPRHYVRVVGEWLPQEAHYAE